MYTLEHMELVHSIRKGKLMAQPETTAISSMACIMARESAYTGKTITWEDITNATMDFMPAELALTDVDMAIYSKVPLPGQ